MTKWTSNMGGTAPSSKYIKINIKKWSQSCGECAGTARSL